MLFTLSGKAVSEIVKWILIRRMLENGYEKDALLILQGESEVIFLRKVEERDLFACPLEVRKREGGIEVLLMKEGKALGRIFFVTEVSS